MIYLSTGKPKLHQSDILIYCLQKFHLMADVQLCTLCQKRLEGLLTINQRSHEDNDSLELVEDIVIILVML